MFHVWRLVSSSRSNRARERAIFIMNSHGDMVKTVPSLLVNLTFMLLDSMMTNEIDLERCCVSDDRVRLSGCCHGACNCIQLEWRIQKHHGLWTFAESCAPHHRVPVGLRVDQRRRVTSCGTILRIEGACGTILGRAHEHLLALAHSEQTSELLNDNMLCPNRKSRILNLSVTCT